MNSEVQKQMSEIFVPLALANENATKHLITLIKGNNDKLRELNERLEITKKESNQLHTLLRMMRWNKDDDTEKYQKLHQQSQELDSRIEFYLDRIKITTQVIFDLNQIKNLLNPKNVSM